LNVIKLAHFQPDIKFGLFFHITIEIIMTTCVFKKYCIPHY